MPEDQRGRGLITAALIKLRWLVVIAWLVGTGLATMLLPRPATTSNFAGMVPQNSPAVRAQTDAIRDFGFPLLTDTAIAMYDAHGIPSWVQEHVATSAAQLDDALYRHHGGRLPDNKVLAAVPLMNALPGAPSAHAPGTTGIVYIYMTSFTSLVGRQHTAEAYLRSLHIPAGVHAWVTGVAPARVAESNLLLSHLTIVEVVTLVLVCLIVGLTFRSLLAPVVTVVTALLSFLLDIRVLGLLGEHIALNLPSELEPLIVALVLGVLTDYSVLLFTALRRELRDGAAPALATRTAARRSLPIIAVAGLTVTAGTAALYTAPLKLYRVFGPGLAVSVFVAAVAAVTFLPALTAILGRAIFWPAHNRPAPQQQRKQRVGVIVRVVSTRFGAALVAIVVLGALGAATYEAHAMRLNASFVRGLPASQPVRVGADTLSKGFAAGILAPTIALVQGQSLSDAGLSRLESEYSRQPGVAAVLGPQHSVLPKQVTRLLQVQHAARLVLVFRGDPLGANAVDRLSTIETRSSSLLSRAGLSGSTVEYAGYTALASSVAAETGHNLTIILAAAFGVEFLILAGYLRSVFTPLLLLLGSALVVGTALGFTTLVFERGLHSEGLMFYAPFATSVLLVALGSDYNVFVIGRIRDEAATRRLRDALRTALPESRRAVRTAGLTLAASFAVIAVIPLLSFREMAFTMFTGLLVDTFIVRSFLVPSFLTLLGPCLASWPGSLLGRRRARQQALQKARRDELAGEIR